MTEDLSQLSAVALSKLYGQRKLSPVEPITT